MPDDQPTETQRRPHDSRPLDQRLRDLADRLSGWVDSLLPEPPPVLVPVPVRKRRRR